MRESVCFALFAMKGEMSCIFVCIVNITGGGCGGGGLGVISMMARKLSGSAKTLHL